MFEKSYQLVLEGTDVCTWPVLLWTKLRKQHKHRHTRCSDRPYAILHSASCNVTSLQVLTCQCRLYERARRCLTSMTQPKLVVGILLYPDYETLDVMGPVELLGVPPIQDKVQLSFITQTGEQVTSAQGLNTVPDHSFHHKPKLDVLLVPGTQTAVSVWVQ